jgi:SAM-dependent methyltransferase
MLAMLRERFAGDERLVCVALDGTGLGPVAAASVDAVFSFDVFVHLPPWDVFNYLGETRRVLRPGGKAAIHHGNVFSPLGWANFLDELPYTVNRHKPYGNFSPMTPGLFRGFAERAGLRVVACRTDVVRRDAITLLERD